MKNHTYDLICVVKYNNNTQVQIARTVASSYIHLFAIQKMSLLQEGKVLSFTLSHAHLSIYFYMFVIMYEPNYI